MQTEVKLPQFGMGMSEAEVLEWFVAEGSHVDEGDDLVEVEAEKAREVLAAPVSGTLVKIAAQVGDVVEIRSVLAVIES